MTHELTALPLGSVLVHLGPHKTGSSALQSTLHHQRSALLEHGVLYPGTDQRHYRAEWALTGRQPRGTHRVPPVRWDELVEEVRASSADRVCISSEGFAAAEPSAVEKLVRDLGEDRVHVVLSARRLDRLLPSAWQQRVQGSHERRSYDMWLRKVLDGDPMRGPHRKFWRNHDLEVLLRRWTAALPPERVLVMVVDEDDRSAQLRTFEQLLGLPAGLLVPGPRENRSLSYDRVELLRRINAVFHEHGWSHQHRLKLVTRGLQRGLLGAEREQSERGVPDLPRWAADRVAELSNARVDAVRSSGARVIGDLELLRPPPRDLPDDVPEEPDDIPIEVATRAVEELVAAAVKLEATARKQAVRQERRSRRARRRRPRRRRPAARSVDDLSSKELLRVVARRQRARLLGRRR
ncbi:MAG: hypothetical protein ACLGIV_11680 [Actinomycetes bacterium]